MGKNKILGLFSSFSKKNNKQRLNQIEILDFKVIKCVENPLYFWKLPFCEMTFIAKDGQTYTAHSKFTEMSMWLEITIDGLPQNVNCLIAKVDEVTEQCFGIKYERIDIDKMHRNLGIAYALQEMFNRIAFLIAKDNNIEFKHIHGKIGTNGDDEPEYSMLLYKSFDNKVYDGHKMILNPKGFNTIDCNLEYFVD